MFPLILTATLKSSRNRQLSDYLGVPVKTLYEWRTRKVGPRALKVGRALRYPEGRVIDWLEERP